MNEILEIFVTQKIGRGKEAGQKWNVALKSVESTKSLKR